MFPIALHNIELLAVAGSFFLSFFLPLLGSHFGREHNHSKHKATWAIQPTVDTWSTSSFMLVCPPSCHSSGHVQSAVEAMRVRGLRAQLALLLHWRHMHVGGAGCCARSSGGHSEGGPAKRHSWQQSAVLMKQLATRYNAHGSTVTASAMQ